MRERKTARQKYIIYISKFKSRWKSKRWNSDIRYAGKSFLVFHLGISSLIQNIGFALQFNGLVFFWENEKYVDCLWFQYHFDPRKSIEEWWWLEEYWHISIFHVLNSDEKFICVSLFSLHLEMRKRKRFHFVLVWNIYFSISPNSTDSNFAFCFLSI